MIYSTWPGKKSKLTHDKTQVKNPLNFYFFCQNKVTLIIF